jgi:tetratricopeptide (TPR) repeat protein
MQTGDYRAAAASFQQALKLFRDFGHRPGEAQALTGLGDLSSRTARTQQAQERYTQALAIARNIGLPLEEASALERLGHIHLHDGTGQEGAACLQQALAIYQHIGAPPPGALRKPSDTTRWPPEDKADRRATAGSA